MRRAINNYAHVAHRVYITLHYNNCVYSRIKPNFPYIYINIFIQPLQNKKGFTFDLLSTSNYAYINIE